MALYHLSDMSMGELDEFIQANSERMEISQADAIALRLRRQRRAYIFGKEQPPSINCIGGKYSNDNRGDNSNVDSYSLKRILRLLLLGDETDAKLELATLLYGEKYACQVQPLLEVDFAEEYDAADGDCAKKRTDTDNLPLLEVFVPGVADVTASLRGELCVTTDVILLCFSLSDCGTFDALRERWWKEVLQAFSVLAQDLEDAGRHVDWPATPVVVVGLVAEARRELAGGATAAVVSHTEAVQLARAMGASKYIEVASGSVHHATCLLTQCTNVAHAFQQSLVSATASFFLLSAKQYMLRRYLRVPKPEGKLDVRLMKLTLCVIPGITYVFTDDGSDPRRNSSCGGSLMRVPINGVIDLRAYKGQSNTVFRICGKARCAYTSSILEVRVPSAVLPPQGYFDPVWRRFIVVPNAQDDDVPFTSCEVRYTLDGSKPSRKSLICKDFIQLDSTAVADIPWGPWRGTLSPPRVIQLSAFAGEGLSSPSVAYETPTVLKTPKIVFSVRGSTICLESTDPMAEYRYTLDGKTPTRLSALYSGPLSINADETQQVRVVAFPKVFFPSRETVFYVPTGKTLPTRLKDSSACSFYMTRSALMRGQHTTVKNGENSGTTSSARHANTGKSITRRSNSEMSEKPKSAVVSAASSLRVVSPRLQTGARAALRRVRDHTLGTRSAAETLRETQGKKTPQGLQGDLMITADDGSDLSLFSPEDCRRTKSPAMNSKRGLVNNCRGSGTLKSDAVGITNSGGPLCMADGNAVVFDFPEPISLSHLTVVTPGNGGGPTFYEVEVKHLHGKDFLSVGSGNFRDIKGVQKLNVVENTRLFPVDRVRCVFGGGTRSFTVSCLKVHGKPFKGTVSR